MGIFKFKEGKVNKGKLNAPRTLQCLSLEEA